MVALLNKRPKKIEPSPLDKAEAQLADLRAELVKARARVQEIHFELDSLTSAPDDRARQLDVLRSALSKAESEERGQEGYISLVAGHSGQEELQRLRTLLAELTQQIAATEAAQLLASKERQSRERELQDERAKLERTIAETDTKIRTLLAVKERLQMERGSAIQAECDTLLTSAERLEQDCVERLTEARRVAAQARADAAQRLETYPALRRDLAARHRVKSDPTSEALEAAITLLEILVGQAYEVNQSRAGYPAGVDVMLAEFAIEPDALQAASVGDVHSLMEKKNRLEGVLRAYLRNLAM